MDCIIISSSSRRSAVRARRAMGSGETQILQFSSAGSASKLASTSQAQRAVVAKAKVLVGVVPIRTRAFLLSFSAAPQATVYYSVRVRAAPGLPMAFAPVHQERIRSTLAQLISLLSLSRLNSVSMPQSRQTHRRLRQVCYHLKRPARDLLATKSEPTAGERCG